MHTFAVRATDAAGNTDGSAAMHSFSVDTTAPETEITKVRVSARRGTAKVRFAASDPPPTTEPFGFMCALDRKPFAPCTSPTRYKRLKPGRHKVRVTSSDALGNEDASAAKKRFRVR